MKKLLIVFIIYLFIMPIKIAFAEKVDDCNMNNGCVKDSFFVSKVVNMRKSGNKYITIQMEFENLTDQKEEITFFRAILVDTNGKASVVASRMPTIIVPEKGKRVVGLYFEFDDVKQLSDKFNLTIEATSPPGTVSFVDLKVVE